MQALKQGAGYHILGPAGHRYGVRNVNDKIKIVYGSKYGVTIESAMGEGTVVTLRIGKKGETSDESDYL